MTFADQEWNQTASNGAGRACNENAHGITSWLDNLPQSRLVLLPMDSRVRKRLSAEARRARIVEAAASAFARDGYDATKMDSIATGAGITKPVLYDHFPSKQALFVAVLESIRDGLIARGKAIVRDDGDPEQKFRRSVDAFLEFVEQAPDAARVLLTVPAGNPVAAKVSREVQAGASAGIAALLAEFMPGRMPWHRQATAAFLKEGLHAVAVWWLDHPGPSREEITDIILDAAWLGLRGQAR
ncbi:TetR/AcrR family transcriptional regulator [Mesorhizobium sp. NZP2077]|nr:TetR/AcrR family transcriptional regulator [Mesorhizobium sp. NZP2077]